MNTHPVRLCLKAHTTLLLFEDDRLVTLPIGARGLAETVLRHDPPTSAELERVIDAVEDALSASRLPHADRSELLTTDAALRALPGMTEQDAGLTRAAIEALFQQLVLRTLRLPTALEAPLTTSEVVAALVLLRECMHHLGFERIRLITE